MAPAATRARILEATLSTIRTEGISGTSARAIGREAGVNQASIYYHFGGVNEAIVEAVRAMSVERLSRYEQRLVAVASLPELVDVAAELHREDVENGIITVLSQAMAGSVGEPDLGPELAEIFAPWTELVARALRQAVDGSPFADALPLDDLADVITALFLGVELVSQLDPDDGRGDRAFAAIGGIARLFDALLRSGVEPPTVSAGSFPDADG